MHSQFHRGDATTVAHDTSRLPMSAQEVYFRINGRKHRWAVLIPENGVCKDFGTWYRVYLRNPDGYRFDRPADAIALYRFGVLSLPCNGRLRLRNSDPADAWVDEFPSPGEKRRWFPAPTGGDWLTKREAATCLSHALKTQVRPKDVPRLTAEAGVTHLRYRGAKNPLYWEGDLSLVVRVLQREIFGAAVEAGDPNDILKASGHVWKCTDIMPSSLCDGLDLQSGATYAQGAQAARERLSA